MMAYIKPKNENPIPKSDIKRIGIYEVFNKPSIKYLAIYTKKDNYAISVMCEFFEVSRSGYYDFVKRMNKPSSRPMWLN